MKKEEIEKITNSIIEKVGEEKAGLIADDIGLILTDNNSMNSEISNRDTKINQLQKDKEMLITTNGNLLQQIGMGKDEGSPYNIDKTKEKEKETKARDFDYRTVFDDKRKF